jgi:adenylosuccinate lyase
MLIAYRSLEKGLNKLLLNEAKLNSDLESNWAVLAEAIQTILRREGYEKPYEALKALTRTNEVISQASIKEFILNLQIGEDVKNEMLALTPQNYTGI